jgi:hypothetical protein
MKRFSLALIAGLALVSVVPATAPATTKCTTHKVSYTAHGTYVSSNPILAPGTYTGDLTINLVGANHHFTHSTDVTVVHKGTKTVYTYTGATAIMNAKATFSAAVKKHGLEPGDHVTVTGTLTVESGKGCTSPNTVSIHHIYVTSKTGK